MNRSSRLTLRARLTLIYTGLFAVCGAILVAVSYTLVAQLGTSGGSSGSSFASIAAQCKSEQPSSPPNKPVIAGCVSYLEQRGAQLQRNLTLSHLLEYSLITLTVVIALAALLGWIFAGRALRPVHRVTEAARAASEHNLSARVALSGPRDELRELAETFDEMLDRLQASFESQRQFIANASHELRTPLAVMGTTVDVVAGNPDSTADDLRGMAADIRTAVGRAEHLIGALLILARNDRGLTIHEEVDLATIAEDVLDTAQLGDRRVHAALEPAVIKGDPVLAEHLIANLVDNAIRYNIPTGDIWLRTFVADGSSQVTVANTGPLVGAENIDRIFQPFQRLHDRISHDGFGLGLAIVASIATLHSGTATACPRDGGGLIVTVAVPSVAAPGDDADPEAAERSDAHARS